MSEYTIEARPHTVKFSRDNSAVLVIDMQNDFGSPGGMFDRAGVDISGIRSVVAPTRRVLQGARRARLPIIYIKMEYEPDLSDLGSVGTPNRTIHDFFNVGKRVTNPDGSEGRILVKGTWNTAIIDELAPQPGDRIVSKNRYSGFFETTLDATLKELGTRLLIVTGCTTSVCVESTIRDAMFRGYHCVLLSDCAAEPLGAGNHNATLLAVETLFGSVSNSEAFLCAVR